MRKVLLTGIFVPLYQPGRKLIFSAYMVHYLITGVDYKATPLISESTYFLADFDQRTLGF
jgi:hypothetical protein